MFKISEIYPLTFSRIAPNVWHIGAVAASKYFPAGDKRAISYTFSSGGSAAIEPICSLGAVLSICIVILFSNFCLQKYKNNSYQFKCYFQNLPAFPNNFRVFFWSGCVSPNTISRKLFF
jgi:hypothetical protein